MNLRIKKRRRLRLKKSQGRTFFCDDTCSEEEVIPKSANYYLMSKQQLTEHMYPAPDTIPEGSARYLV